MKGFTVNWPKAVLDICLIVVGVSIALAADSWLADRVEQRRTEQLLAALEDEWTTELSRLEEHIDSFDRIKKIIAPIISAHDFGVENLSDEEITNLMLDYEWSTFKSADGALSTLMVDGVQNVADRELRMAIASWRTVLNELNAEQTALRQLGTLTDRALSARIAQKSGVKFSAEAMEDDYWSYGMSSVAFARAAIADDEWVANQRHFLNLFYAYQEQLVDVRNALEVNLVLLRERTKY